MNTDLKATRRRRYESRKRVNAIALSLSLMAMVFLPSTFLTGLFGVNLGGIPGNSWHLGFSLFCLMLVVVIGGVAWWLHRSKWL